MTSELSRMLNPSSIAVIGGGAWCEQLIKQCKNIGYEGDIWPVHPKKPEVWGYKAYPTVHDLPSDPDGAFVGVNRYATVDIVRQLSRLGCGGAVCLASGFSEAASEDEMAGDLQDKLIEAAGDMPFMGPNCYGFINALDGALLWPDQQGLSRLDSGVAILTQSSNISMNITMQERALPIAYMVACGNMAQTSQAKIAMAFLEDPRVTAIGMHIEGFGDLREWEAFAEAAHKRGVPVVALKVGSSEQAQRATISHTGSLAGSNAGAQSFLERLGIPRLETLPALLETLKLLHAYGPLPSRDVGVICCSGGEASMISDLAMSHSVNFPHLSEKRVETLRDALGPLVALHNPLDYHTYIWRDAKAMAKAWSGMTGDDFCLTLSIVDYPKTDQTDWIPTKEAALQVRADTGDPFGVVSTLPELLPPDISNELMEGGVVPFHGLQETLAAIDAAAQCRAPNPVPVALSRLEGTPRTLTEAEGKDALAAYGVAVPLKTVITQSDDVSDALNDLTPPFVVKGVGMAHKSEHNAVRLGIAEEDVAEVAKEIGTEQILIEEMVVDGLCELIIGVTRDPAHGYVLTLGTGGILTELLQDAESLLIPSSREEVLAELQTLKSAPLLNGYRGKPAVDLEAVVDAVMSVQSYVLDNTDTIDEVEINPLICTADRAVAVDALIRKA